jgi:hypothetical protein
LAHYLSGVSPTSPAELEPTAAKRYKFPATVGVAAESLSASSPPHSTSSVEERNSQDGDSDAEELVIEEKGGVGNSRYGGGTNNNNNSSNSSLQQHINSSSFFSGPPGAAGEIKPLYSHHKHINNNGSGKENALPLANIRYIAVQSNQIIKVKI